MNYFSLKVITPEHTVYDHHAVSLTFPTGEKEQLTILPNHQPLITTVGIGELRILDTEKKEHIFFVNNGVLHIHDAGEIVILVDESESVHEISIDLAEKAYERAQMLKDKKMDQEEIDFAKVEALIERELGRVTIARKYRKI